MRGGVGGRAILGLGILTCRFVLHLLTMMLNHTPRGGPQNSMMSGDVADDAADRRAFQASFGISHAGEHRETDANGETGSNLAHFHSPDEYR